MYTNIYVFIYHPYLKNYYPFNTSFLLVPGISGAARPDGGAFVPRCVGDALLKARKTQLGG